jgi:hypothetical protein
VDAASKLRFDDRKRLCGREGGHLVLERREFLDVFKRQEIGARTEGLADLDERWSKIDQARTKPNSLFFESRLLLCGPLLTTKDNDSQDPDETIERSKELRVGPRLQPLTAATPARQFSKSRYGAAIKVSPNVVGIQKQIERQEAQHARDTRGTQPTANPLSTQNLVNHLFRQRLHRRGLLWRLSSSREAVAVRFCSLN